ncbi:unnamed protein product [Miscanthus lutarioriparius]|uniref:F-box protein At3g26010-like beta-propeller domain-containing protein n=1 Tax=Miscanthus lutarioriparius TaxID=422564 RepID=A0A811PRW6_9POAL|nr:unnamed protein product [Miscanthus lutarioriparius]
MAPEAIVQLVDGGEEEEAQRKVVVVQQHLDDNIMSTILSKLPSEPAHRFAVVSKSSGALLRQPAFLQNHLSSRRSLVQLLKDDELPSMVAIQPKDHQRPGGYVHLTIVNNANPTNPVSLHLPVHHAYQHLIAEHAPAASPAEGELATFLMRTIPKLDASFVASDGPMLLARNPTRSYFVCYPAANRWIALPPPPAGDTVAAGFRYVVVDAASGTISFMVVLVAPDHVATFSSKTGEWGVKEHGAHEDVMAFGAWGPGIRAGNSIYWQSAAGDARARVLCFDVARGGRVSAFREPPLADGGTKRVGRSLGSASGRLRLCAFDVRDNDPGNVQLHAVEGVHGVFFLDDGDAGTWRRAHEVVVRDDISVTFFGVPHGAEVPVDFTGASGSSIIVNKNQVLFRRDLEGGNKVRLFDLNKQYDPRMARLYNNLDMFPLF